MSKSKRKLLMALLILTFVVLVALAMFSAIFALEQVKVTSSLELTYDAPKDVYATIKAYKLVNGEEKNDDNITTITITGGEGNVESATFNNVEINDLDDPTAYIYLQITNNEGTNSDLYVSTTVTYTSYTNIVTNNEEDSTETAAEESTDTTSNVISIPQLVSFNDETNYEEYDEKYVFIQQNQTAYLCLKFTVDDLAYDANFEGTINLSLKTIDGLSDDEKAEIKTATIAGVGLYPQTYVGDTLNETLKTATLTATGNTYTTDVSGTETTLTEYEYKPGTTHTEIDSEGNTTTVDDEYLVAKLESSSVYTTGSAFSTGETITSNSIYFFYVQPIKVSAMGSIEINGGVKTIWITKSIVFSKAFHSTSEDGNSAWGDSPLCTFLNGTFLTESGINATEISIENDIDSDSYTEQNNTNDTLWLPSETEVSAWYTTADLRKKKPTDMTLATYIEYSSSDNAGCYWTRSASAESNVYIVDVAGSLSNSDCVNNQIGISFAFVM